MNKEQFFEKVQARKFELDEKRKSFEEAFMDCLPLEEAFLDFKNNLVVEVLISRTPLKGLRKKGMIQALRGINWILTFGFDEDLSNVEIVIDTHMRSRKSTIEKWNSSSRRIGFHND